MSGLPVVHIAKNGYRCKIVLLLDVRENLPVVGNAFVGLGYMYRGGLQHSPSFPQRNVKVKPQQIHPVGISLHVPLPFRGVFAAEYLRMGQTDADAA